MRTGRATGGGAVGARGRRSGHAAGGDAGVRSSFHVFSLLGSVQVVSRNEWADVPALTSAVPLWWDAAAASRVCGL
jgi:hypothetical protein